MKVKMPNGKWEDVGALVEVKALTFHESLPRGTVFAARSGVEVFFDEKDLACLGGGPETTPRF